MIFNKLFANQSFYNGHSHVLEYIASRFQATQCFLCNFMHCQQKFIHARSAVSQFLMRNVINYDMTRKCIYSRK